MSPTKSPAQHNLMEKAKHDPAFAKSKGIPKEANRLVHDWQCNTSEGFFDALSQVYYGRSRPYNGLCGNPRSALCRHTLIGDFPLDLEPESDEDGDEA